MSLLMFAAASAPPEFQSFADIERLINPADWSDDVEFVLEVHGLADAGTLRARLYNVTLGQNVAGSGLVVNSTSKTRARSSAFSLTAGDNVYTVQYGGQPGNNYTLFDAVLIASPSS